MEENETREENPIDECLRNRFGLTYLFPYQRLVITSTLEAAGFFGNERAGEAPRKRIVILPTGAGKSLCFMLPAALLKRPSLIIFPLLSLMGDQQRRLEEAGIPSVILRGGQSRQERQKAKTQLEQGKAKVLLSNPETLLLPQTQDLLEGITFSQLIIDETHTVSEWGDTFRPRYRELNTLMDDSRFTTVTAYTATASDRILNRLQEILFPRDQPQLIRANPDRPNISYYVHPCLSKVRTLRHLISDSLPRPAVIFFSSRGGTEHLCRQIRLSHPHIDCAYYHAGLPRSAKEKIEKWFFDHQEGILFATTAYGMGVDKKNIRSVIHYDTPPTVESYLQESGRGGRDREPAEAHLLFTAQDLRNYTRGTPEMRRYMTNNTQCRREMLLSMLQAEMEYCSGCDVCRGTAPKRPPREEALMRTLKRHTGRMTIQELRYFLKGWLPAPLAERRLFTLPGFGLCRRWDLGEIHEALLNLLAGKKLILPRRGLWKGRISLP